MCFLQRWKQPPFSEMFFNNIMSNEGKKLWHLPLFARYDMPKSGIPGLKNIISRLPLCGNFQDSKVFKTRMEENANIVSRINEETVAI